MVELRSYIIMNDLHTLYKKLLYIQGTAGEITTLFKKHPLSARTFSYIYTLFWDFNLVSLT